MLLAFAAIYLIWGSTYLAIRVAVETLPPFTLAERAFHRGRRDRCCTRGWPSRAAPGRRRASGATMPSSARCCSSAATAVVVWAEQKIPSGITTLLLSINLLIMVLLDWMLPQGLRPSWATFLGLALGFGGLVLLVGSGVSDGATLDPWRCAGFMFSCIAWSFGSIYSRHVRNPADPLMAATLQMLLGGILMLVIGLGRGELHDFHLQDLTSRSVVAWAYLVVAGSLIAFPCYLYLLKHSTPARASTYAYVNPVVAVFLGWLILGEPVTGRTFIASVVIITAVVIITTQKGRAAAKKS